MSHLHSHRAHPLPAPFVRHPQSGAALLVAMLIVVLIASFSAAATWQQWAAIQAEGDARAQVQSKWLIHGAVDWSRIILYLDKRTTQTDDLNEPWALALAEAKLSTFLTADENAANNANADMTEAFFSGGMSDLQGRLNITNLVNNNELDATAIAQFQRLFSSLGLAAEQVQPMAQNYLNSLQKITDENPTGTNLAAAPLTPICLQQLGWLGIDQATIHAIAPYVTILPNRTKLNINTAPELVLWAALPDSDESLANKLVSTRQTQPFSSIQNAQTIAGDYSLDTETLDTATNYFLVRGNMRLDTLETSEQFVLERNGSRLRTVRRECPAPVESASSTMSHNFISSIQPALDSLRQKKSIA